MLTAINLASRPASSSQAACPFLPGGLSRTGHGPHRWSLRVAQRGIYEVRWRPSDAGLQTVQDTMVANTVGHHASSAICSQAGPAAIRFFEVICAVRLGTLSAMLAKPVIVSASSPASILKSVTNLVADTQQVHRQRAHWPATAAPMMAKLSHGWRHRSGRRSRSGSRRHQ